MNRSQRACQIWAVLAWAAKNRQTLTYGLLSQLIRVPAAGLGQLLEPIQSYCSRNNLPPLTILVVQHDSGLPGNGFIEADATKYPKMYIDVYEHDWLGGVNPGPDNLPANP